MTSLKKKTKRKRRLRTCKDDTSDESSDSSESSSDDYTFIESSPEWTPRPVRRSRRLTKINPPKIYPHPPPFIPTNLDTLIELCHQQKVSSVPYVDCERLPLLLPHLLELKSMIGLDDIKLAVVRLVIRLLQVTLPSPDLNHMVIYGNPGVGKTTFVNILAKILCALGTTKNSKVVHASQDSMVAGFLGQTAEKTINLVESAIGGVLLIDEASSISDGRSNNNTDSFSKSAVDTLNRLLTERGSDFICILAGYEHEIQRDFFSINPGLVRRFPTVFKMGSYSPDQLAVIANLKLEHANLVFAPGAALSAGSFAGVNAKYFTAMGGDVGSLVSKIICAHGQRTLGVIDKRTISKESVEEGYSDYIEMKLSVTDDSTSAYSDMYI